MERVDTESRDDMTTLTEEPDCERFVSRVSQLSAGEAEVLEVSVYMRFEANLHEKLCDCAQKLWRKVEKASLVRTIFHGGRC